MKSLRSEPDSEVSSLSKKRASYLPVMLNLLQSGGPSTEQNVNHEAVIHQEELSLSLVFERMHFNICKNNTKTLLILAD